MAQSFQVTEPKIREPMVRHTSQELTEEDLLQKTLDDLKRELSMHEE